MIGCVENFCVVIGIVFDYGVCMIMLSFVDYDELRLVGFDKFLYGYCGVFMMGCYEYVYVFSMSLY